MMHTTAGAIAERVGGVLQGDPQRRVAGPGTLKQGSAEQVAFFSKTKPLAPLEQSQAGTVLISRELDGIADPDRLQKTLILVDDPQEAFLGLLPDFFPPTARKVFGISDAASVAADAVIGAETNIHPGAIVAEGATIGARCDIHPGVSVGPGCRIGDDCVVYPNAVLYAGVSLGHRVTIHAGAVIGADGFGFRLIEGRHVKVPHYGTVIIEDDVEIGACTTIDRSFLGATRIGAGTKIDNQVMIAHNCELGRHNILVSQVGFAGSVTTGDYVVCAGQVGIADHVHLGTGSVFGAKAGVHKDMPGGQQYLGAPAVPESECVRQVMALKKLPEMRSQIKHLERQLQQLQSRLADDASHKDAA